MPLFLPQSVQEQTITTSVLGTITTTSAVDVLVTAMTATPAAGRYLVLFTGTVSGTAKTQSITLSVWVGGAQVGNSERVTSHQDWGLPGPGSLFRGRVALQREVTANGSQTVEIRWRNAGGGIASLDGSRAMTLFRAG